MLKGDVVDKFSPREHLRLLRSYLAHYPDFARFPHRDAEQVREFQWARVKAILEIAYHSSPFYQRLYRAHGVQPADVRTWEDFARLPTVTKQDIMGSERECLVRGARTDRLRRSRSSGSSGQFIEVYSDTGHWLASALATFRMMQQSFGFNPFRSRGGAVIYTSELPFQARFGLYTAAYLNTLMPRAEMIRRLVRIEPEYIVSYPSIIAELMAHFPAECRRLRPKAILTNSEQSTQLQRDQMASFFGCPVPDEYSTEELREVAFQCAHGAYHLQEDCVYTEILDPERNEVRPDGQVGEIVGTSFTNPTMPFVRYRQGDLGSLRPAACDCGRTGRILDDISGRKNSSFRLTNGDVIPSGRILDWTYKLFIDLAVPIAQFEVVQTATTDVTVRIVTAAGYDDPVHGEMIRQSFRGEFGSLLSVRVETVAELARTPAGKHIPIRSLVW